MAAAEVERSQSGSNSYDGRGSMEYPENATVGDKVDLLRIALSPGSSLPMHREAICGLWRESSDMLSRIVRTYGRDSYIRDVNACIEQLGSSGDELMWHLVRAILLEQEDLDAIFIHGKLKKNSLRDATRLICSRTALEIEEIKESYHALFGVQLEVDIGKFTDGNHKKLLLKFISIPPARYGDNDVDMVDREHLESTLISLRKEIRKIPESPQNIIMNDVVGKSKEYIGAVFDDYTTKYGRSLETDLRSAGDRFKVVRSTMRNRFVKRPRYFAEDLTSGQDVGLFEDGLLTMMKCSVDRPKYFAEVLHTAKIQNDRETIVWAIATMAKRPDMERIKAEYPNRYGRTLEADVSEEFSDCQDYLELIHSLLNYNVPNRVMRA